MTSPITGGAQPSCCPLTYVPALGTGPARESPALSRYCKPIFLSHRCRGLILELRAELVAQLVIEFRDGEVPTANSLPVRT
jgi:hypothetical protein